MVKQLLSLSLGCALAAASAWAQTNTPAPESSRNGAIVVPDRPAGEATAANEGGAVVTKRMPPEVMVRIERFKLDARVYLEKQDELKRKMQGASKEERDAIREQLKQLREQWLERSRELRQEYKDRKSELQLKLKDHKELFDDVRNAAKERARDAGERPRRGND